MKYDNWLEYIEDLNEFPFMAYLSILRNVKCNELFIIGPNEKIEFININNGNIMNEENTIFDIRTIEGKKIYDNIPEDKIITWISENKFTFGDEEIDLNPYDYSMDEVY